MLSTALGDMQQEVKNLASSNLCELPSGEYLVFSGKSTGISYAK